jgi:hypothetical protein
MPSKTYEYNKDYKSKKTNKITTYKIIINSNYTPVKDCDRYLSYTKFNKLIRKLNQKQLKEAYNNILLLINVN